MLAALVDLSNLRSESRAALASRLWDAVPNNRASANLREVLRGIRRWEDKASLRLLETGEAVHRSESTLESDLFTFEHLPTPTTVDALRNLHELYSGDLLEDVEADGEDLRTWLAGKRNGLRERFVELSVGGIASTTGVVDEAILTRLETTAPTDDRVARAVMLARSRATGAEGARRTFDMFSQRLKSDGVGSPEPATRLVLRELGAAGPVSHAERIEARSLAQIPKVLILPPSEAGPASRATQTLAAALIDEVTHTLARSRLFAVFAPYSARQIAATPFPNGKPYGTDYVVTTRLLPGRAASRLTVQLLNVSSQEILLSEEVRFSPEVLGADHQLLAAALAARLAGGVERAELEGYHHTGAATTFVHHLLGSDLIRAMSLQSVRRGRSHLQKAIRLASDFAPAQSMLARALCLEWLLLDRKDLELIDASLAIAERARERNPMDPIAHREVGHALIYLNRGEEAVEAFETAVAFGPHDADVLFHYGDGLAHEGRIKDARVAIDKALNLNPLAPDLYLFMSATTDYLLGNYAAASRTLEGLREPEPAARVIALVEAMHGDMRKAHRHRDIFMRNHPDFRLADYQMPMKNAEQRAHYLEGMRRAGFS